MALECRHVLAARSFFAPVIEPAAQSAAEPRGIYGEMPDMRQSRRDIAGTGTFATPDPAARKFSIPSLDHGIAP
jgi:hypothetical protein